MKSIKIAGLCLVAICVASLSATATASAAGPVWEQCREGTGAGTEWENSTCTKASATGAYVWREVTATEKITSSATVALRDVKVPVAGTVEVQCSGTGEGKVGPGAFGVVATIAVTKCVAGKNCEEFKKATPVHLPWQTELYETENTVRGTVRPDGNGTPGWEIECKVLGITKADLCTSEDQSAAVENTSSGTVRVTSDLKSGKTSCTVGGSNSGELLGTATIFPNETGAAAIKVS